MFKKWNRQSIRLRMVFWVSGVLLFMMIVVFLVFRSVSISVLEKTIRNYLISAVDTNSDEITYLNNEKKSEDGLLVPDADSVYSAKNIIIEYKNGKLVIDEDFLDTMNDVESALYTSDGKLLYGKNPIAEEMDGKRLKSARIYTKKVAGEDYYIYDRKLVGTRLDGLWIRGVASLKQPHRELREITRILLFFLPVMFILVIVGGFLTSERMLAPVRKIEQSATDISNGDDLSERIPLGEKKDELYRLTVAFNEMLDRLEKSFEVEKQFTSDASHELRTPLSVIMAQIEMILGKERAEEEYLEAFEVIGRQGSKMTSLVEDMLTYTRLEQGTVRFPREMINLSEVVQRICDDMAILAVKEISLHSEIEPELFLQGNELLLSRLLQNLIDNAYKYGKEKGHIFVRLCRSEKKEIILSVEDDGIGISEEEKDRIFDRFYRSDRSRSRRSSNVQGSGLGLSIVKKIADYHGAGIDVVSQQEKGSCFQIIFENKKF